ERQNPAPIPRIRPIRPLQFYRVDDNVHHTLTPDEYGKARVNDFLANSAYLLDRQSNFIFRKVERVITPCTREEFIETRRQYDGERQKLFCELPYSRIRNARVQDFVNANICVFVADGQPPYMLEFRKQLCTDRNWLTGYLDDEDDV